MALNTAEMKKGSHETFFLGTLQTDSRYPESMSVGTHFIRFVKVGNVKDGTTELEKNKRNEFTGKGKSRCMYVTKKVLQSIRLLKMHIFNHCILLVEMA